MTLFLLGKVRFTSVPAGLFLLVASFAWSSGDSCPGQQASGDPPEFLSAGPVGANASLIEDALGNRNIAGLARKLRKQVRDAIDESGGMTDLSSVIAKPNVRASLAQQELIRCVGEDIVAEIAAREGGVKFLTAFLEDPNWVESFLVSNFEKAPYGLEGRTFPKALDNLYLLHRYGKNLDKPVYRRLATAMALRADMLPYWLIRRFHQIQDSHRQGLLHAGFDTLDVREMEWAIYLGVSANRDTDPGREYDFLLNNRQQKIEEYINAWRVCWWVNENPYGDSPQGPFWYRPLEYLCGCTTESTFVLGGQCENISRYGWGVGEAHGVMSGLAGQPAHCCHTFRMGKHWPIAYDCAGGANTDFNAPGWEGTHYATANWLYEPVQQDRVHFLAAHRLAMIAKMLSEENRPQVRILPGLRYMLYRRNVGGSLPDFSKLKPDDQGPAKHIDIAALKQKPPYNYGAVWMGRISVSRKGDIRVAMRADDHGRVWIDGKMIVESNNSPQANIVNLTAGVHALGVQYCQGGGNEGLEVDFNGVTAFGDWKKAYAQAFRAQPLNYGIWLDCMRVMENTSGISPAMWRKFSQSAAQTFSGYHEAGWALVRLAIEKRLPTMKPEERRDFFLECHRIFRRDGAKQYDGYQLANVLNWQADQLGDPAAGVDFFDRVLHIHAAPAPNDEIFSMVLEWGQNRFVKNNPATAPRFVKIIGDCFKKLGGEANSNLMQSQIQGGIRAAGERGDIELARLWMKLGKDFLPPLQPSDVRLSPEQAAQFPKIAPFPGTLLSADGILRISSFHGDDRPQSYSALLSGGKFGGFFHANSEDNPWAQVQLPGNAAISGIVLVNRYEMCPERQVPLKISVSPDGAKWTEVASFAKADNVFRADLQGKNIQAKFVRVERPAGRNDYFHLRAILIYGRKLY